MKIYDISVNIFEDTVVWPGDPKIKFKKVCSIEKGDVCNVSEVTLGVHTATHIDAPYHFINSGERTDNIPLEDLIGKCVVIEVDCETIIKKEDIINIDFKDCKRVLFKTKNSYLYENKISTFNKDFISVDISAAIFLTENGVKLIGIDYLSVEGFYSKNAEVHKFLLNNNIILLEGLNLFDISPNVYELVCLPLKLKGTDGAPARVILKDL